MNSKKPTTYHHTEVHKIQEITSVWLEDFSLVYSMDQTRAGYIRIHTINLLCSAVMAENLYG